MDERLLNAVKIGNHPIGAQIGGFGSGSNSGMRRAGQAVTKFKAEAKDVNESMFGPSQKGIQLAQKSGPMINEISEAAKEIAVHRASVKSRMSAPIFTDWSKTTPAYHSAAVAMELAKRFYESTPAERAKLLGAIATDPCAHMAHVEALSVVPAEISGLSTRQKQVLHAIAFKATKADEFAALEVEQEQVGIASRAVSIALDIAKQAGADLSSLPSLAPDAVALQQASPLRWPDPRELLEA